MSPRSRVPLTSRLLALLLALAFAIGPAVPAASACATRTAIGFRIGRACCCRAAGALRPCCASPVSDAARGGPRVEPKGCGCELRAPAPDDALPRTAGASAEDGAAFGGWIASGAHASASTALATILAPLAVSTSAPPPSEAHRPAAKGGLLPLLI
jgi:hypothetical protein